MLTARHSQIWTQDWAVFHFLNVSNYISNPLHSLCAQHRRGMSSKLLHQVLLTQWLPPVAIKGIASGQNPQPLFGFNLSLAVHFVKAGLITLGGLHLHFGQKLLQSRPVSVSIAVGGYCHFVIQQGRAGVELKWMPGLVLCAGEGTVNVLGWRHSKCDPSDLVEVKIPNCVFKLCTSFHRCIHHPVHPQVSRYTLEGYILTLQNPFKISRSEICHWWGMVVLVVNPKPTVHIQDGWVSLYTHVGKLSGLQASPSSVSYMKRFGLCGSIGQRCPSRGGGNSQSMRALCRRQTQELSRGCSTPHHSDNTRRVESEDGRKQKPLLTCNYQLDFLPIN